MKIVRFCIWLLPALFALICLITAICLVVKHLKSNDEELIDPSENTLKFVKDNLEKGLINEVDIPDKLGNCPRGTIAAETAKFGGVD